MARKRSYKSPDDLIEKITTWALGHQVMDDAYISGLIVSLRTEQQIELWADLDPYKHLPNPDTKIFEKSYLRLRRINLARNVLVFIPVGLTWASISATTSAFGKFESEQTKVVANFLDFWQNGYGYLSEFWKLSTIASIDAILVTSIVLLTILINSLSLNYESKINIEEKKIKDERFILAFAINEYLITFKKPNSETINKTLAKSLRSLNTSLNQVHKINSLLEKEYKKIPNNKEVTNLFKKLLKIQNEK